MSEETNQKAQDSTVIGSAPAPSQPAPSPGHSHPLPPASARLGTAPISPASAPTQPGAPPTTPVSPPGSWTPSGGYHPPLGAIAAPAIASDADSLVGQELCGYTIRRKLAEGGMGVVYAAEHAKIGRAAAIKVLKLELCHSEEMVERFYQEARAVNAIHHENIVDVYDFEIGRAHV